MEFPFVFWFEKIGYTFGLLMKSATSTAEFFHKFLYGNCKFENICTHNRFLRLNVVRGDISLFPTVKIISTKQDVFGIRHPQEKNNRRFQETINPLVDCGKIIRVQLQLFVQEENLFF
ncbi:hypothetical protein DO657_09825 [Salmonella enterica subsp. enterica serovar Thompson]|nr:hypothetical protein [Salmonella enterica subsp. enterica serovar Thompson]